MDSSWHELNSQSPGEKRKQEHGKKGNNSWELFAFEWQNS